MTFAFSQQRCPRTRQANLLVSNGSVGLLEGIKTILMRGLESMGTHHEARKETVDGCGIQHTKVFHETVTLGANSHRGLQFVNWASCQDAETQTMPPVPAPAQLMSPSDGDKDKTAQASPLEASHVKKSVLE